MHALLSWLIIVKSKLNQEQSYHQYEQETVSEISTKNGFLFLKSAILTGVALYHQKEFHEDS